MSHPGESVTDFRLPEQTVFSRVVAYRYANSAASMRVVAMHGALRSAEDISVLAGLLPDVELTTIDLPGHGNAPHSPLGYTAEALAQGVLEALQAQTDDRPVVVIGESFSGVAALCLARLDGGVAHVVLLDTPLDTTRMSVSRKLVVHRHQIMPVMRPMLAGLSRDYFGVDIENRSVTERTYHEYVRRCPVPVTMITGAVKVMSPAGAGAFFGDADVAQLNDVPAFSVVELPDTGHGVLALQPQAVGDILQRILRNTAERVR